MNGIEPLGSIKA